MLSTVALSGVRDGQCCHRSCFVHLQFIVKLLQRKGYNYEAKIGPGIAKADSEE